MNFGDEHVRVTKLIEGLQSCSCLHKSVSCSSASFCIQQQRRVRSLRPRKDTDVVISTAGLCCAALLARYGQRVTVVESHYLPGEQATRGTLTRSGGLASTVATALHCWGWHGIWGTTGGYSTLMTLARRCWSRCLHLGGYAVAFVAGPVGSWLRAALISCNKE